MKSIPAFLIALPLAQTPASAATLFADNFNRANSRNIDASLTGITDNTGSSLAADAVYSQPWLDPNNAAPTYGAQDGSATNGGGTQVLSSVLQLATGVGTSNAYINHNFTNASILSAGGFSITVDISGYTANAINNGGGFGIGMTAAEAASMGDAVGNSINSPHLSNAWVSGFGGTGNAVSDFWVALRGTSTLAWGTGNTVLNSVTVAPKYGTISAAFSVPDFNAGSNVGFEVFYAGVSKGTGSFQWTDTNANYIGLDGRDGTFVGFDNLEIATVPEPSVALLGLAGFGFLIRRKR